MNAVQMLRAEGSQVDGRLLLSFSTVTPTRPDSLIVRTHWLSDESSKIIKELIYLVSQITVKVDGHADYACVS